jgi:RNA polymerase sigma-70 factor (ECF subfamily)
MLTHSSLHLHVAGERDGCPMPMATAEDPSALFVQVYAGLRRLADRYLMGASTLQPTALVHEVFLRLGRQELGVCADREHFLAIAATAMRQIAVDHARRRNAAKRGGDWARVTLDGVPAQGAGNPMDVLDLDRVLGRLAGLSPRQAKIVELRLFAGMTVAEVAQLLAVSVATVEKDWRQARAWMRVELARGL